MVRERVPWFPVHKEEEAIRVVWNSGVASIREVY